jgi:hypothetical protein
MPPMPRERDKEQRRQALEKFQRGVAQMTNSPRFRDALEAFEEDPDKARSDPKGFLEQHGIQLPADATAEVVEQEGSYCYCIRVCWGWWCSSICVCVG